MFTLISNGIPLVKCMFVIIISVAFMDKASSVYMKLLIKVHQLMSPYHRLLEIQLAERWHNSSGLGEQS